MSNRVAIVILNYNGMKHLKNFLHKVVRFSPDADVIVADNGSSDGSSDWVRSEFPSVRTILLDKNYGFAEGYNMALKQIDHEYYILLNSDVEVQQGWMSAILAYMDSHDNCMACQPKILSQSTPLFFEYAGAAGGFIDRYGYPYCRGRILSNVEKDLGQYDSVMEIFWATGACLMIRREAYWSAGGLDGRFFAHQEEIDLCWRLKARGGSIVCVPQSVVYHVGAGTLSYDSPFKTFLNFRNNALLIYKNADSARYPWIRFVRLTLDIVAALHLLAQGRPKNAWSVCRAQFAFWRMKNDFKRDREENMAKTINKFPVGVLNHPLLFDVYFKRKRTFSAIHKDMR